MEDTKRQEMAEEKTEEKEGQTEEEEEEEEEEGEEEEKSLGVGVTVGGLPRVCCSRLMCESRETLMTWAGQTAEQSIV